MARHVLYTRLRRAELIDQLSRLPRILTGKESDRSGLARGFSLRLAVAFLQKVKLAFIVKARGGRDECGISWPPLTREYLAYGRGPKSTRTAGKLAPGGKDGFMSPAQLKQWQRDFARNLKWLAARNPPEVAKAKAAAMAWAAAKRAGVRTKLDVFGRRRHTILQDRGILFNSLQPGIINELGPDASYVPPGGQVVRLQPGSVAVGSNVAYAAFHQNGTRANHGEPGRGAIRRQLWPNGDQIPASWSEFFARHAAAGIPAAIKLIAEGKF